LVVSGNASEAFSRAIREIARRIGGEKVLTDPEDLIPYSIDASKRFEGAPWAVVRVNSTEDVAAVLEVADRERIPVIPRGSASCLTGAVVAKRGGIVIDLLPMNRVEVYPEDMVVMAEAGATVQKVDEECRRHGLMFPPDPASSKVATVGGALAENAGGIRGAKYGVMKNWLLALEVVLPGGRVLRVGEPTLKWRWGPDLTGLFVGSEGWLGVITRAWFKVIPAPERVVRVVGVFPDMESAGRAAADIRASGILPLGLEIMNAETLRAVSRATGIDLPQEGAMLIADVDGPREAISRLAESVAECMRRAGGEVTLSDDPEEMERLYLARKMAYASLTRLYKAVEIEDITVPLSRFPEALRRIDELAKRYGLPLPTFGHAGDGNVHPTICYDPDDEEQVRKARRLAEEICDVAIELGGAVSGEHGIGIQKIEALRRELRARGAEHYLDLLREIKRILDPNNIMNPGNFGL